MESVWGVDWWDREERKHVGDWSDCIPSALHLVDCGGHKNPLSALGFSPDWYHSLAPILDFHLFHNSFENQVGSTNIKKSHDMWQIGNSRYLSQIKPSLKETTLPCFHSSCCWKLCRKMLVCSKMILAGRVITSPSPSPQGTIPMLPNTYWSPPSLFQLWCALSRGFDPEKPALQLPPSKIWC